MTDVNNDRFSKSNFEKEIFEIRKQIEIVNQAGKNADESFLAVGDLLVKTKRERNLEDKVFTSLKHSVSKLLDKSSLRNINKVVSIAECDIIQKHKDKLPKSWSTLYVLSRAKNLDKLIAKDKVNVNSTRSQVTKLVDTGITVNKPKWVYVELASNQMYTAEELKNLNNALSGSGWIVKSKTVELEE